MTDSTNTYALASVNASKGLVHVLMGKYEEPANDASRVLLRNVSRASFSVGVPGRLRVRAERIPDVGSAPLEHPALTVDACVPVEDDRAEIVLDDFVRMDAYRMVLSSCDQEKPPILSP
jgi:hypothetical protein